MGRKGLLDMKHDYMVKLERIVFVTAHNKEEAQKRLLKSLIIIKKTICFM